MTNTITPLFQIGPRITAQVLGSPYQQFRPTGANNPTSGSPLATIPAWLTADQAGKGTRAQGYGKPVWYSMHDPAVTQVGDYLIGPLGTFFIASQDAPMPFQAIECNKTLSLSRPGAASPGAGYYGGGAAQTITPLASAWPASVLQGTKGEKGDVQLPGDTRLAWVVILLPVIPGVQIVMGDWLVSDDATPQTYTVSSSELTALGWRITASSAVG